jgi:hypothetical protein
LSTLSIRGGIGGLTKRKGGNLSKLNSNQSLSKPSMMIQ